MGRISSIMINIATQNRRNEKRLQEQRFKEQRQRQQQKKKEKYIPYRNEKYLGDRDENGNAHGKGTFIDMHGNIYEGSWKNGNRHGYGIQDWKRNSGNSKDEHIYYGCWKDNIMHGKGVMYDVISHRRKCGYWNNGVYQKRSPRLMNLRPENNGLVKVNKYKYKKPPKTIRSKINQYNSNKSYILYFLVFLLFISVIVFSL